jgi:mRNA interferase MazF
VFVAPFTSRGRATSFRPALRFKGQDGLIVLDQLRAVDKTRLLRRIGTVDDKTLEIALRILRWIFTK